MHIAVKYITVILWAALKFVVGVGLGIGYHLNFWERLLCLVIGGILGTTLFTYFGGAIRAWWLARFPPKATTEPKEDAKKWHAALWKRYGLVGTALLTPPILSPPIGTALALAFGAPRGRIVAYMAASIVLWSFIFAWFGNLDFERIFQHLLSFFK